MTEVYDPGEWVYEKLKAVGEHNSIKDLNNLRLSYRQLAKENQHSLETQREQLIKYADYFEQHPESKADTEAAVKRYQDAVDSFTKMYKAIERLIQERKGALTMRETDLLHTCADCGATLQEVRPGKYQCDCGASR